MPSAYTENALRSQILGRESHTRVRFQKRGLVLLPRRHLRSSQVVRVDQIMKNFKRLNISAHFPFFTAAFAVHQDEDLLRPLASSCPSECSVISFTFLGRYSISGSGTSARPLCHCFPRVAPRYPVFEASGGKKNHLTSARFKTVTLIEKWQHAI